MFLSDHYVGDIYTMVINQQEKIVREYKKPPVKKSIAGQMFFRGEIKKSQEKLFPILKHGNAISFDQSYYTRTLGQIRIQNKLEEKHGKLTDIFSLATGAGFGALQALWLALGNDSEELLHYFARDIRKAVTPSTIKKIPAFIFSMDTDRLNPKYLDKAFKRMFKKAKVRDLKIDVFIPIMDVSGRVHAFNRDSFKSELLSDVAFCAVPDPVFFKLKAYKNGMGVLNGDIAKNNDVFLRKNNPNLNISSVGAPVRYYDKGYSYMTRDTLSLKISDQKHQTDLWFADEMKGPRTRYECKPIDEVFYFSTKESQMDKALDSGDIEL
jgi:hypothetical protein